MNALDCPNCWETGKRLPGHILAAGLVRCRNDDCRVVHFEEDHAAGGGPA